KAAPRQLSHTHSNSFLAITTAELTEPIFSGHYFFICRKIKFYRQKLTDFPLFLVQFNYIIS
ncbi:hypothetical protein AALM99_08715, partial [Lactococcus muris]